ncbi:ABC transporter permease [Paracraurococcus lichenis]|uniref:ABC transporter permease n=1 Tax=Paracraurococcus lichenis TaxID=3064888 RepID=A0ABT9E462_9PROT|nr:FtsX-like permease family protein [Paracraurococcus sp. LOR1-02]MDO9710953.1 ABC transporter permease [Paracraurococcus sp. LOR1-02]
MGPIGQFLLGLRLARRELRGGIRSLRIVLACLALGVAAIAAVGTLRAAIEAGLAADGARILGGDVELRSGNRPATEAARAWIEARGGRVSAVVTLRSMLVAPSGERMLVELKAVDKAWPLYGALELDPPVALGTPQEMNAVPILQAPPAAEAAAGEPRIALDPLVAERLGLAVGDRVRIGEASFRFVARVAAEPDKATTPALFGPRALITEAMLARTQLLQPGALVQHDLRIRLPEGASRARFAADLRSAFAGEGWRIRTADQAEPGVNRFLDRAAAFLTLAGLTALLVGGIGVATGVRGWLDARARSIATLRCLGAPSGIIFLTYLIQVLALAGLGILAGLLGGYGLTWLAAQALSGSLPVPPRLAPYPAPLALAALYGLLTALAFALWPLGRAARISGAALFRDAVQPAGAVPSWAIIGLNLAAAAALVALIVLTSGDPAFALGFCGAAVAALLLFRGGAWALAALARRLSHLRRPALRLGLANLHRPGAPTALLVVSLGIGLTTLAAIAQIEGNIRRQLAAEMPSRAPNFFFIDIQSDQAQRFDAVARGLPGVTEVKRVPSLRARIVAVKGVPAERAPVSEDTAWALRGDRGLTYAARLPEGTRLVAGSWWAEDYRGEPLLSLDANLARGWGVGIGDAITVNVLGRDIDLRVANLRAVDWRGLGMNFTLIASPGLLEAAPHTHIATVRGDAAQDAAVLRALTDAFPNISGIRVRDALEAVAAILGRVGTALTATGSVTLLAGLLVLAGAVAAGQRQRVRDAVVLKTLGATRAQIRAAWMVEYALVGLVAGLLAALMGSAAAWAVVTQVMRADWVLLPGTLAATVLGCAALTLACGQVGTALALRARPGPLLRNE